MVTVNWSTLFSSVGVHHASLIPNGAGEAPNWLGTGSNLLFFCDHRPPKSSYRPEHEAELVAVFRCPRGRRTRAKWLSACPSVCPPACVSPPFNIPGATYPNQAPRSRCRECFFPTARDALDATLRDPLTLADVDIAGQSLAHRNGVSVVEILYQRSLWLASPLPWIRRDRKCRTLSRQLAC